MPAPLQLNASHRNTLLAGFRHIDGLLTDALAGLAPADDGAIFAPVVPDATAMQRKVVTDQMARLRRALRAALDACAIPVLAPAVSAVWSLRSTLTFIDITLEDLSAKHLRGYGPLDEPTAQGVAALQAQIRTIVTELQDYLEAGLGGDLSARLARLDQTTDEVRLLRELERVVTAHGLAEFRHPLALLLERLEKNWWTVAFVGRVSCGKSSLLNYLLSTDVLPSGVTPVTAVPIRIIAGSTPATTVTFATGKSERLPAARLADFASEEKNPGNARQVTDILLELNSPWLAGDVCLVDTPGLGSLATAGAEQTLAFLPRCDVGVLLIDAAATLSGDDIAVVQSLLEGGAEVLVVLSKADLLSPADREKVAGYVTRQLAAALGRAVPVALVSVIPNHAGLTETWWREVLAPRQARHRELAAATLRRKIGALREAVVGSLARRTGVAVAGPASSVDPAGIGVARATLEHTRRELYDLAFHAAPPATAVLASAAAILARITPGDDPTAALARELGRAAAEFACKFENNLQGARDVAVQVLTGPGLSPGLMILPRPSARPLFDPAPVIAAGRLPQTSWRWPVAAIRRCAYRLQLRAQFASAWDEALRTYGHALSTWGQHYLDELSKLFNAEAAFIEARLTPAEGTDTAGAALLISDYEALRDWNPHPAA